MTTSRERAFDLVLWGATGYTGRLVAAALAELDAVGLRWAIAGRDRNRLEGVRSALGGAEPAIVVADASDAASLAALAGRARVIASTVGPYARHGTPLVAACVAQGTHYADLTGEVLWMRRTIDAFHGDAIRSGSRIVHACGFDSVPSDLGVWCLQQAAIARHGRPCTSVVHGFGPLSGGVSGGTVASGLDLADAAAADPAVRRALIDPDLLAPGGSPSVAGTSGTWPRWDDGLRAWTAPFFMARVNEAVVRRTRALLAEPWGTDFRYHERWRARGWAEAAAVALALAVAPALRAPGPLRALSRRFLPAPGQGPSAETRARGHFRSTLVGRVAGVDDPVVVHVASDLDPGYGATALMLREAALSLAHDDLPSGGGVLTPAAAFGDRLVWRLQRAGVRFELAGG